MNKSRYVTRPIDKIDLAIVAALSENGRMKICQLAEQIGMSSPSVSERMLKLEDAGAILGYTAIIDPKVFGLNTAAHLRIRPLPGQLKRVEQMLKDTPQLVGANRVTGEDCFEGEIMVRDEQELQAVVDQLELVAVTDAAIILSSTVPRRLPRL